MTQHSLYQGPADFAHAKRAPRALSLALGVLMGLTAVQAQAQTAPNYPVTAQQRATAQHVAQAGVPLSELSPNAPDSYTVKRGDTLWHISSLFLRSPWRWPELWGMNLQQIRNPHLIFPGQYLYLDKSNGRARLRVGQPVGGDAKLSPRVREGGLYDAISTVPLHLIEPYFNEAVILQNSDELLNAPRIVATQEGRVLVSRNEKAYVRGDTSAHREWRLFREPKPLRDPSTREVLGYEAQYVGTVKIESEGTEGTGADGKTTVIPSTVTVTGIRQEAGVGDRLAAVPPRDFDNLVPHAPSQPMDGQIVSVYGEALNAGQNQIVALNRGTQDGMERGHVMALWRDGRVVKDSTSNDRATMKLPDERHGLLFVFRVFDRMSYALILSAEHPVGTGDRFTQP